MYMLGLHTNLETIIDIFLTSIAHSRDIHFLLFYSIWTLRTTPIQLVSVLFIAALYIVPNLI